MEGAHWVLDEFHFFSSRVRGILGDVLRGLGTPEILSKTLLECNFLLGQNYSLYQILKGVWAPPPRKGLKPLCFNKYFICPWYLGLELNEREVWFRLENKFDIMILFSFDHFWKKNLGFTNVWGIVEREGVREEREFGWIHDLVRNILYFYPAQIKSPQKNKTKQKKHFRLNLRLII